MTTPRVWRRLLLAFVVVVLAFGGLLAAGSAAMADPNPAPAPTPAPAPSAPKATPTPTPTPGPPQPAPPPPTGKPSPTPVPTPDPAPGPLPPGGIPTGADDDSGGGLFDIAGDIRNAIVSFIEWIATTGLKPVLTTLGGTVLSTPDLTANTAVHTVWMTSLVVANSIFVLLIVIAGFIMMSQHTLQAQYGLKEILPRIAVAGIVTNTSLLIIGKVIEIANALCTAIAGQGVDGNAAAATINEALSSAGNIGSGTFLIALLILGVMVMAIMVIITFVLRIAMLVLLIVLAPLALICHAIPQTEGLAYMWWRGLFACFAIQLGQAVILLATLRVFLTPKGPTVLGMPASSSGLLGVLVCLTMLWLLVKMPAWMRMFILGPLGQRHGGGLMRQIIGAVLTIKTLGAMTGITKATSRTVARTTRTATGRTTPVRRAGTPTRRAVPATTTPPTAAPPPGGGPTPAVAHTPLSPRAGQSNVVPAGATAASPPGALKTSPPAVAFSHAPTLAARPRPTAAVRFSHHTPASPPSPSPRPTTSPRPVFSSAPTPPPSAPAAAAQPSPRRTSPPAAPTFSHPTRPPAPSRRIPRGRET
jgi:hypothetical protein